MSTSNNQNQGGTRLSQQVLNSRTSNRHGPSISQIDTPQRATVTLIGANGVQAPLTTMAASGPRKLKPHLLNKHAYASSQPEATGA